VEFLQAAKTQVRETEEQAKAVVMQPKHLFFDWTAK
jgi:hypothetical protein